MTDVDCAGGLKRSDTNYATTQFSKGFARGILWSFLHFCKGHSLCYGVTANRRRETWGGGLCSLAFNLSLWMFIQLWNNPSVQQIVTVLRITIEICKIKIITYISEIRITHMLRTHRTYADMHRERISGEQK